MSTMKNQQTKRAKGSAVSDQDNHAARKRAKVGDTIKDEKQSRKIWLNDEFVVRPNYPTSYGILFYRKVFSNGEGSFITPFFREGTNAKSDFQYLLGLIPQGNSWTVFKGLPENNESPGETAIREFEEESSLDFPYDRDDWKGCPVRSELYGVTSTKKLLHIFLIPAPKGLVSSNFDVKKVVKIDSGRFAGKPEIIEIKYLTKKQALEGFPSRGKTKAAKIYKSQISILERADAVLNGRV